MKRIKWSLPATTRNSVLSRTILSGVIFSGVVALAGCSNSANNSEKQQGEGDLARKSVSNRDVEAFLTQQFTRIYPKESENYLYRGQPELANAAPATDAVTEKQAGGGSEDFSGTNNQVAGVDEGDIWKYDGEIFYVLKPAKVSYSYDDCKDGPIALNDSEAVSAKASFSSRPFCIPARSIDQPASVRVVRNDKTQLGNYELVEIAPTDLYLSENTLAVIGNEQKVNDGWYDYRSWQQGKINIKILDVENPSKPEDKHTIAIDGYMVKSRRIGDELYIISRYSPNFYFSGLEYSPQTDEAISQNKAILNAQKEKKLLPEITVNGNTRSLITEGSCWLLETPKAVRTSPILTSVSRINLNTGEVKNRCLGGQVQGIYMSQNNLYLYDTVYWHSQPVITKVVSDTDLADSKVVTEDVIWDWGKGRTLIHQFDLDGFNYVGSGSVTGVLGWQHQSFRFGELEGEALGVVTTTRNWRANEISHELHIIKASDGKINALAKLPNDDAPAPIGKPGEDIYSVRFMQNRAYIVTFQRTDPLYVIDLTDPAQPKVTGELEIPGFSEYLHPVGDNLLIGVGKDAVEGTRGAVYNQGVKVSLFDVSDITKPEEKSAISIGKRGTSTPLSYDHLAFTGIAQGDVHMNGRYRFAFPIMEHGGKPTYVNEKNPASNYYPWLQTGLYLFEMSAGELKQSGAVITDQASEQVKYESNYRSRRGLIQGDKVYHLRGSDLFSADWGNAASQSSAF